MVKFFAFIPLLSAIPIKPFVVKSTEKLKKKTALKRDFYNIQTCKDYYF